MSYDKNPIFIKDIPNQEHSLIFDEREYTHELGSIYFDESLKSYIFKPQNNILFDSIALKAIQGFIEIKELKKQIEK